MSEFLSEESALKLPAIVSASQLNSSYLIEELCGDPTREMWGRGTVTELGSGFINSGPFVNAFGRDDVTLVDDEFATRTINKEEMKKTKLQILELGPECDHVQGKVSTHRYLLCLLVPISLIGSFDGSPKNGKPTRSPKYKNESVMDIGRITLKTPSPNDWHLLISCKCFMSLAAKTRIDGHQRIRLRRALIEEVAHRYATYARRPGVMRFF